MKREFFVDEFAGLPEVKDFPNDASGEVFKEAFDGCNPVNGTLYVSTKPSRELTRSLEHIGMLMRIRETAQIRLRNRFDVKKRI